MTTPKFVFYVAILVFCIMHARSEDISLFDETPIQTQPSQSSIPKKTIQITNKNYESLVQECASREIKRCDDSKCRQIKCSASDNTQYGCLPKGNDFMKYKSVACKEAPVVAKPVVNQKPNSPEAPQKVSGFYLFSIVALIVACGALIYSKSKTQSKVLINFKENDLESKTFGKSRKYNDFCDLDETTSSFVSRNSGYRATKSPEYYLLE